MEHHQSSNKSRAVKVSFRFNSSKKKAVLLTFPLFFACQGGATVAQMGPKEEKVKIITEVSGGFDGSEGCVCVMLMLHMLVNEEVRPATRIYCTPAARQRCCLGHREEKWGAVKEKCSPTAAAGLKAPNYFVTICDIPTKTQRF